MNLKDFLNHLVSTPALQEEFARDPAATMSKAGLSSADQALLYSRDVNALSKVLGGETALFSRLQPFWPGHRIRVHSITPDSGARGTRVQVVVKGSHFRSSTRASLLNGGASLDIQTTRVIPGGDDARLEGYVDLEHSTPRGRWILQVSNGEVLDASALLDAFTVT